MIDNNVNAQPQSAINSAYVVYEIIVEGGETRLMALFKDKPMDMIGPIRSARPYFIHYANEHNAIYSHIGASAVADEMFKDPNLIDRINGQVYDTGKARTNSSVFWRESHKKRPHNAYTSIPKIQEVATKKGFPLTSDKKAVLNYSSENIILDDENSIIANAITIPYTSRHKVKYIYNPETQRYEDILKGEK